MTLDKRKRNNENIFFFDCLSLSNRRFLK